MKILITNDDGIMAPGIRELAIEIAKAHDVTVVAPKEQRSANSHAITLFEPITIEEQSIDGFNGKAFSVAGTPADCVRLAMEGKLVENPDFVLSGINLGYNAGMDILYSGTVSAAIEANVYKIPSMAISSRYVDGEARYDTAAKVALEILEFVQEPMKGWPLLLNVNVPYLDYEELGEMTICPVGNVIYDRYERSFADGAGPLTLSLTGRYDQVPIKGSDRDYLSQGNVTITPLIYDLTNYSLMNVVRSWFNNNK
ncbi:MAG: 5'/3'-nucleotidase SurE [Tissierellia bacterium]|nr:5'/3'-nucleotidase SurE [Tissierellia bacterium]